MKNTIINYFFFFTFSISKSLNVMADSNTQVSSGKKYFFSALSDYGIPLAAETGLECLRAAFEPIKNIAAQGICGSGPQYYICWYLSNSLDLQKYNIQNGLSRHLQEKVSSASQYTYNSLFGPKKAQGALIAAKDMESLRLATSQAQSTETIKARISLGQLRPILDSLFGLASESLYQVGQKNPTQRAAQLVGYAAILLAIYFPEYDGSEPEIALNAKSLFHQINRLNAKSATVPDYFRTLVESELSKYLTLGALEEPVLMDRVNTILCAWVVENPAQIEHCQKANSTGPHLRSKNEQQTTPQTTLMGLIAPSLLFNLAPRESGIAILTLRTTLNSLSQNTAEAATRVDVNDFFADMRRSVQRLGAAGENSQTVLTDSYKVLRERQLEVSMIWSELGLRMRANLLRYLSLIVPSFVEASKQINLGQNARAAGTLATLLGYIRQYDPEYRTDDVVMKLAAFAILGAPDFLESPNFCSLQNSILNPFQSDENQDFKGTLYSRLAEFDPGFEKASSVSQYYDALLAEFSGLAPSKAPSSNENDVLVPETIREIPWLSVGLSWIVDVANAILKTSLAQSIKGLMSNSWQTLVKEQYSKVGEVFVRAAGEPAKDDIQQWLSERLATKERSNTENQLISSVVEMSGRTGIDSQMARAIYERLEPVLFHLFDEAREAYQYGDKEAASRLIAYSVLFITYIYPEAPPQDSLIAGLAKGRFSQFVEKQDLDFARSTAAQFAHYIKSGASRLPGVTQFHDVDQILAFDSVLACQLSQRLQSFDLTVDKSFKNICQKGDSSTQSWLDWSTEHGKSLGYALGMGAVILLPGIAAVYTPKNIALGGAPQSLNFFLTCLTRATISLTVTSVFGGITKGALDKAKSLAQRWSQYFRITNRVDENENWGRSQDYFGQRQWDLAQHLSPTAQEGRKDLLTVAQNIAQNLKNAKIAYLHGNTDFAQSQVNSLKYLISEFYEEGKTHYEALLSDMSYAFLGNTSLNPGPQ